MIVGGHPVIRGIVRLACDPQPDLQVIGEAGSIREVVEQMRELEPDVLVLDLDLPDGDGLEALRQLRDGGFEGPVLALTDRVDGAHVLRALRMDVFGYLSKSEGMRRMGESIVRVARRERVIDPELERAAVLELGRFARRAREGSQVGGTLTPREREILDLLAQGLTVRQISRRLQISPRTVETHVAKLYRKLDVRSRVQAVARAASIGLVELR
jgi:DNA-binding NarL/FixJ family response regulator